MSILKPFNLVLAVLALLSSTLLFGTRSQAQSATKPIKYGESITSEITDAQTTVSFTFSGNKNDVVLLQLLPIFDKDGKGLSRPVVVLNDTKSKAIADTSKGTILFFGGSGTFLAAQLGSKGDYTITVSKDKDNKSTGQFTLDLTLVELLQMDKAIQGTISTHTPDVRYPAVYAISSTDDFGVEYARKQSSKFTPSVTIHAVDRAGIPVPVVYAAGNRFISGTLGVEGSKDLYLVTVGDFENDVRSTRLKDDEQIAEFSVKLVAPTTGAPN